jgi:hypothetical protein
LETGDVRKQLLHTLTGIRERGQQRRVRAAEAEKDFATFLELVAIPLTRQLASALKAEGYAFTVFTPGRGLRLALDKGRDDFIDVALDTERDHPEVIGSISYTRGSRTIVSDQPVKAGVGPGALTEADVFEFLLRALEPFLER